MLDVLEGQGVNAGDEGPLSRLLGEGGPSIPSKYKRGEKKNHPKCCVVYDVTKKCINENNLEIVKRLYLVNQGFLRFHYAHTK